MSDDGRVSAEEAASMKNKIIVESKELLQLGLEKKAFDEESVILVDEHWHRVQKPQDGQPKSVILWMRDNPSDTEPTEEKIVSSLILPLLPSMTMYSLVLHYSMPRH